MIKTGQYGRYYEYEQDGQTKRLSLPSKEITEQLAEQLIMGKQVQYEKKFTTYKKIITAKTVPYTNKKGKNTIIVKEEELETIFDSDLILGAVSNIRPVLEQDTIESLAQKFKKVITELELVASWGVRHFHHSERAGDKIIYYIGIEQNMPISRSRYGESLPNKAYIIDNSLSGCILEEPDEQRLEQFRAEVRVWREKESERRAAEATKAREKAIKEEEERIRAIPWKERYLEDYKDSENQYNELLAVLQDKYPDKDPSTLILYKYKYYNRIEHDIHNSRPGYVDSWMLVTEMLPGLNPKDVLFDTFFLVDTGISETTEYGAEYKVKYRRHNAD